MTTAVYTQYTHIAKPTQTHSHITILPSLRNESGHNNMSMARTQSSAAATTTTTAYHHQKIALHTGHANITLMSHNAHTNNQRTRTQPKIKQTVNLQTQIQNLATNDRMNSNAKTAASNAINAQNITLLTRNGAIASTYQPPVEVAAPVAVVSTGTSQIIKEVEMNIPSVPEGSGETVDKLKEKEVGRNMRKTGQNGNGKEKLRSFSKNKANKEARMKVKGKGPAKGKANGRQKASSDTDMDLSKENSMDKINKINGAKFLDKKVNGLKASSLENNNQEGNLEMKASTNVSASPKKEIATISSGSKNKVLAEPPALLSARKILVKHDSEHLEKYAWSKFQSSPDPKELPIPSFLAKLSARSQGVNSTDSSLRFAVRNKLRSISLMDIETESISTASNESENELAHSGASNDTAISELEIEVVKSEKVQGELLSKFDELKVENMKQNTDIDKNSIAINKVDLLMNAFSNLIGTKSETNEKTSAEVPDDGTNSLKKMLGMFNGHATK